uniref:DUF19 domain-containing protein n=1 Tax=Caenorhabditis tropicalis TaxID=1561998 RepID=A0A1I7UK89_9PELO
MKPLTKNILIGLSVAITIVLILLVILFVVVYVMLVMERNEEHSKLGHCVPLIDSALQMENEFNMTSGFLKSPSVYKELADKCDEAMKCVGVVDSFISSDVLHTFSSCQFHVFYNREFDQCATKTTMNQCEQWIDIQECVKTQIRIICGDEMTKRYEEEAANLRSSFCGVDVRKA